MSSYEGRDAEKEYVLHVAKAICATARTAPHTTANFEILTKIITDDEVRKIQETLGGRTGPESLVIYPAIVLISANVTHSDTNWNCGACGFKTCAEMNRRAKELKESRPGTVGPVCNWKVLDWAIACDYAAAQALYLGVQTRVQAIQGAIARMLGIAGPVDVCLSVPLMAESRDPFFVGRMDRAPKEMQKQMQEIYRSELRRFFPTIDNLAPTDVFAGVFQADMIAKVFQDEAQPEDTTTA